MPRVRGSKQPEHAAPTGPLCPCRELEALDEAGMAIADDRQVIDLKRRVWQFCWRCLKRRQESKGTVKWRDITMRCSSCAPRVGTFEDRYRRAQCPRCAAYTEGFAFLLFGLKLEPEDWDNYPADWQMEFWAVYGGGEKTAGPKFDDQLGCLADKTYLPQVVLNLRDEHALQRVNRVLGHFGRPKYVIDPVTFHVDPRSIETVGVLKVPAYYTRLGMVPESEHWKSIRERQRHNPVDKMKWTRG